MEKGKIAIPPKEGTSIKEETTPFELGAYTIFAGENNAGKTHLLKSIEEKIGEEKVIYIPAEEINAEEQIKISAANDPMRATISKLVDITIESMPNVDYEKINGLFENIKNTFNSFKLEGVALQMSQREFTREDVKKAVHDSVVKKVLEAKILDRYDASRDPLELDISSASQGTQRVIIASIIQELKKIRISGEEIYILFEEPEIYLHPKLKQNLYNALRVLSEQNIKVVISTHDPYFIELGKGQKIYEVFRNPDKKHSTDVKEVTNKDGVLGYRSEAEINYSIFGLVSNTYYLELYEKLVSLFEESEERCESCKKSSRSQYNSLNEWLLKKKARTVEGDKNNTRLSKLRYVIGHKSKDSQKYVVEKEDIDEAIKFISLRRKEAKD